MDEFSMLAMKVLLGAFIAFFMEFSEVTLVTYTSSLTLAIAGIFKVSFECGDFKASTVNFRKCSSSLWP